jgi:hypothetical protein
VVRVTEGSEMEERLKGKAGTASDPGPFPPGAASFRDSSMCSHLYDPSPGATIRSTDSATHDKHDSSSQLLERPLPS